MFIIFSESIYVNLKKKNYRILVNFPKLEVMQAAPTLLIPERETNIEVPKTYWEPDSNATEITVIPYSPTRGDKTSDDPNAIAKTSEGTSSTKTKKPTSHSDFGRNTQDFLGASRGNLSEQKVSSTWTYFYHC